MTYMLSQRQNHKFFEFEQLPFYVVFFYSFFFLKQAVQTILSSFYFYSKLQINELKV